MAYDGHREMSAHVHRGDVHGDGPECRTAHRRLTQKNILAQKTPMIKSSDRLGSRI